MLTKAEKPFERAARALIDRFGENAAGQAETNADVARQKGFYDEGRLWQLIKEIVLELTAH